MKQAAALISIVVLVLFAVLADKSTVFNWFSPRGGVFTLGLSLLVANVGIWLSQQPDRSVNERFQFAVAAWIWLLMQLGARSEEHTSELQSRPHLVCRLL